ncbi:DUF6085 family protein [Tenggerimyces flavus]|uniref:DUF6085 family protein n=1 Tax=Tenggerimyces flavus TaxID=1708749 RepID=A0ABV7YB96_9ACTN|nr:DUF6085 family protein [Tenggerimyces flavus]MBM7788879.1 hypothetical protein [Tenggerimyces flavus]
MIPRVEGYCPVGCGQTLMLGAGGHVYCSYLACPEPTAVDEILHDREVEHVVTLTETDFTIRHPLRERLGDALLECHLHEHLRSLDGPPRKPGRYHAFQRGERWHWHEIEPA